MATPHNFLAELVGCFATPVAENPTVAMIESAFRHHGMNARYINCEVQPAALGDAARGARAMGWRGFNCSIPHKVAIIAHLDGLGDSAATIGAVNCAVRRGDKWIGENTDGVGFMESLRTLIDVKGKSIVVFGAGGAARAIAVEAALAGARRHRHRQSQPGARRRADRTDQRQDAGESRVRPLGQDLSRRRRRRRLRQRDLDRPLSRRRGPGRRRSLRRQARRGRRRRHPQSAAHAVSARRRGPGPQDARRARHAGQPGRRLDPPLVRRRRRGERHAADARGAVRRLAAIRRLKKERRARGGAARGAGLLAGQALSIAHGPGPAAAK